MRFMVTVILPYLIGSVFDSVTLTTERVSHPGGETAASAIIRFEVSHNEVSMWEGLGGRERSLCRYAALFGFV